MDRSSLQNSSPSFIVCTTHMFNIFIIFYSNYIIIFIVIILLLLFLFNYIIIFIVIILLLLFLL